MATNVHGKPSAARAVRWRAGSPEVEVVEWHRLDGVASERRSAPDRSGECEDWPKVKTVTRREANRERKAFRRLLHCDRDVRVGVINGHVRCLAGTGNVIP
jgi:hypothetical protein